MTNTVHNTLLIHGKNQDILNFYHKIISGEIYLGRVHDIEYNDKIITFDSRTEPPCKILLSISKEYKDLYFSLSYVEPLGAYRGEFDCMNGIIMRENIEKIRKVLDKNEMLSLMQELNNKYNETWINHQMTLIGNSKDILSLVTAFDDKRNNIINFSKLVPVPSEDELNQLGININEWFRKNYGTSITYGLMRQRPIVEDSFASLTFYIKDTPGTELLLKLSEKYKGIEFHTNFGEVLGKYDGTFRCIQGKTLYNLIDYKGYQYEESIPDTNRILDSELDPDSNAVKNDVLDNVEEILTQFI